MKIDIRRWLCVTSACALGWVCGFMIYNLLAWKVQLLTPVAQYQQHSPVIQLQQNAATFSHAVVRMVKPSEISSPAETAPILQYHNIVLEPIRSYYL